MLNYSNLQEISAKLKKGSAYIEEFWQKVFDNVHLFDDEEFHSSTISEFPHNFKDLGIDFDPEGLLDLKDIHFAIVVTLSKVEIRLTGLTDEHKYYHDLVKCLIDNGFVQESSEYYDVYTHNL